MKKLTFWLCVLGLAAIIALAACTANTGNPDDTSASFNEETTEDVESTSELQTQAGEETDTELQASEEQTTEVEESTTVAAPEPPAGMEGAELNLLTLVADGESFAATATSTVDFEGTLTLTFTKGSSSVANTYELDVAKDEVFELEGDGISFLDSTYTIDVTAIVEDYVVDQYTLNYKRGKPQLNLRSLDLVVNDMSLYDKASFIVSWSVANRDAAAATYGLADYGIKGVKLADGPGGLRTIGPTMAYPVGTNLAATWDLDVIRTVAASIGDDCVDYGMGVILGPGMNIQKNVRGGRNFEYYSEDPFLTGMMAAYYTQGVQSQGVGVALKHFAVNNQESDRGKVSANVTERALREIYLRGYEYAVKLGDPYTVMSAYNKVNGVYMSNNRDLLETVLRGEFGFNGMVMSDWGAWGGRVEMILAGNDLACGFDNSATHRDIIIDAVNDGRIDMSLMNLSCKRVLTLLAKLAANSSGEVPTHTVSNLAEKEALVRQAGAESMVLMKNEDDVLPMRAGEIALFGYRSYAMIYCGGGSGYVDANGIVQLNTAILDTAGYSLNEDVADLYVKEEIPAPVTITPAMAEEAAMTADYAIFTIGRESVEGNDHRLEKGDYYLSDAELTSLSNISEAFRAAGKPVIVLLNVSTPIEIVSWQDMADAILLLGFAGEEIGASTMDVLTGAVNPCGKLISTWPVSYDDVPDKDYFGRADNVDHYEDIYVGYRYYTTFGVDVAYEFGYGLSYTSYEYSGFSLTANDGVYTLSVTVKNTGDTAGREVVQFYVSKPSGKNSQPVIELAGFGKTGLLAPGESQTITVEITADELKTYYTADSQWIIEAGTYVFYVGASVQDLKGNASMTVAEEILVLDTVNVCPLPYEFDVLE